MYIKIDTQYAYRLMTGGPVIMVATKSKDGVDNIMTCAWNCPFASDEMLIVLDLGHTTTQNIIDTRELTICIASIDMAKTMLAVGNVHSSECGDKFKATDTKAADGMSSSIKIAEGCLAYMECTLINDAMLKESGICHVKVNNAYVMEEFWDKAGNNFGPGMQKVAHHVCEATFISGGEITSYHRS